MIDEFHLEENLEFRHVDQTVRIQTLFITDLVRRRPCTLRGRSTTDRATQRVYIQNHELTH